MWRKCLLCEDGQPAVPVLILSTAYLGVWVLWKGLYVAGLCIHSAANVLGWKVSDALGIVSQGGAKFLGTECGVVIWCSFIPQ